jgi:hypothetical protein
MSNKDLNNNNSDKQSIDISSFYELYKDEMPSNFPESWYWTWNYIDERSWRKTGKLLLSIAFQHGFLDEMDPIKLINSYRDVFLDACPNDIYKQYADKLLL